MEKEFIINKKIRELRKAKHLSQEFMAKELGISQKAYSKIECNETHLNFDRITEIARLLDLTNWQIIALDVDVILGKSSIPDDVANYIPIDIVKRLLDKYDAKIKALKKELKIANEAINQLNEENSNKSD